jgi:hypothetical protein
MVGASKSAKKNRSVRAVGLEVAKVAYPRLSSAEKQPLGRVPGGALKSTNASKDRPELTKRQDRVADKPLV